jgi:glycosyltransferase involved in cell wall biosynthesis
MKFVWASRETPLIPTCGAYVYSNGLLRGLLSTGARGRLVSYDRPGHPPGEAPGLELSLAPPPARPRAMSLLSALPSDSYRLMSAEFEQRLTAAVTADIDALIIDFYAMGWLAPAVERLRAARSARPLTVVYVSHQYEQALRFEIARDHVGSPAMRLALTLDAVKAARLERRLVAQADLITAIAEQDRVRFLRDTPDKPVITLVPGYEAPVAAQRPITAETPRRVILSGALDWIAKKRNFRRFLDAAEQPFRQAGIELLAVGRTDPAFEAEIRARSQVCRFTGEVPDILPYMSQGRIGVMPDEVGGGFKLKLLDYVFGGLPIATISSQFNDLPLDMDRDAIARDGVVELVAAMVEAIDDIDRLEGMRRRALAACEGRFDWAERGVKLAQAIAAASRTGGGSRADAA